MAFTLTTVCADGTRRRFNGCGPWTFTTRADALRKARRIAAYPPAEEMSHVVVQRNGVTFAVVVAQWPGPLVVTNNGKRVSATTPKQRAAMVRVLIAKLYEADVARGRA